MTRMIRYVHFYAEGLPQPAVVDGFNESEIFHKLAGYVLQPSSAAFPSKMIKACSCVMYISHPSIEPVRNQPESSSPHFTETPSQGLQLRPIGRLIPIARASLAQQQLLVPRSLRPIRSSQVYRLTSPPARGLVTPELAEALETVFERFATEHGFNSQNPLTIKLTRGFAANSHGHYEGRAADIAVVGGKSLLEWKQEWDQAIADAEKISDPQQRAEALAVEQKRNLGYALYKALQAHGGWRVNPAGWRVYHGIMQLFGPWTATEGPWKTMQIKNPNSYQRQRLADQQWVFQAHQDHIHVAR